MQKAARRSRTGKTIKSQISNLNNPINIYKKLIFLGIALIQRIFQQTSHFIVRVFDNNKEVVMMGGDE